MQGEEEEKTESGERAKEKRKKEIDIYIYHSILRSCWNFRCFFFFRLRSSSSSSAIGMNNTTHSINSSSFSLNIPNLRIVIVFLCVIIYLIRFTGCFLSIVTFSSRKLRRHSTGFLFLVMAFVDMFTLLSSLQYLLDVIYQVNISSLYIHWCRLITM